MKDGKKVITASGEGTINIFSWDWFGDCNDRIRGHPNSIETMIKYNENLVITGCEDGLMRAVSVLPNRIVAILGDPLDEDDDTFGIHKLTLSHDKQLLANITLDDIVKIFDVSHLATIESTKFDEEEYEEGIQGKLKENHGKKDRKDIEMCEEKKNN